MSAPQIKAITSIPGWALVQDAGKITAPAQAYERIPVVRRAVDIIADSLVEVPHYVHKAGEEAKKEGSKELWDANFPGIDLDELLNKTAKAFLISGAAYWLKLSNRVRVAGVQWLNPTTMRVDYAGRRPDGSLGLKFTQSGTGSSSVDAPGQTHVWDETQVVYFRQWHLADDITPGSSAVKAVLDAANLHYYMTVMAKTTFENGAMPVVLMSVEGNPARDEIERAEKFFTRLMTGVRNAMRVIGVSGVWKPQIISPPLKDLAMPDLADYALRQVAIGMGVPETMLSDAANYATAAQHDAQFWKNTVGPLATMIERVMNRSLLEPMGLSIAFAIQEINALQEDEKQRAQSLELLSASGLDVSIAMQILGYELPGEMTYTQLEARLAEKKAPAPVPPGLPQGRLDVTPSPTEAALRAWERFAVKRVKDGKALREFETDDVPAALKGALSGALSRAKTAQDVRRVFGNALTWQGYP